MIPSSALTFPASHDISRVGRELSLHPPQTLWIGYLYLHHVEAPVIRRVAAEVDPIACSVLRAVQLAPPVTTVDLNRYLGLGLSFVGLMLEDLRRQDLVERAGSHGWQLTASGARAQAGASVEHACATRCSFYFLARVGSSDPEFVPLPRGVAVPVAEPESGWIFAPETLVRCIDRDNSWKETRGFPLDILGVQRGASFQELILDRAEALRVAITQDAVAQQLIALDPHWRQLPRPLLPTTSLDFTVGTEVGLQDNTSALSAWRAWARRRGVTDREAAACGVRIDGTVLHLAATDAVRRNLRRLSLDEEGWLLLGEGLLRRAVRISMA
jgi:hypothetical protein